MRSVLLLMITGFALAQAPSRTPAKAPATFQTTGTLLQFMRGVILPNADVVFNAGNEAPKDAAAWLKTQNAALTVAEAGNLLMIGNRGQGRPDWNQLAKGLIAAGQKTYRAAMAK